MKRLALAALAATIGFACPASAKEQLVEGCAPFATALRLAMDQYGEAPAYIAQSGAIVITITVNPKTGTFSIWGQRESTTMCLVGGGYRVGTGIRCRQGDRAGGATVMNARLSPRPP